MLIDLGDAVRLTQILMGLAFVQQSLEHCIPQRKEIGIFLPRLILAILLITGWQVTVVLFALLIIGLIQLYRFQGPYNGGSDRMSLLILSSLCLVEIAPSLYWREISFGYLGLQLVLSYFISGWVKVVNPEWRNGRALCDVFQFSAYPVSESLRLWYRSPGILFVVSWGVMLFELLFPLALITQETLFLALAIAATFHFSNACMLGLNRFFWIWVSAYPSIIWLQSRIT